MVDSVVIQLVAGRYKITPKNKLDGKRMTEGRGFAVNSSYCKEYARETHKQGRYFPMVELPSRSKGSDKLGEVLEIQVSLPKMIYGSSLFEVDGSDLDEFCDKLVALLGEIGIITTSDDIKAGVLKRVDFSKIIKLPDYLGTADEVIYRMGNFNYKSRSSFNFNWNKLHHGNEGVYIKFWNTTQGYVVYDKFWQIYCAGYTTEEQKIKKSLENIKFRRDAIKFEFVLQHKQSMEAFLRRRIDSKTKDFALGDIMDKKLARGIMLDVFNDVYNGVAVGLISLAEMEQNKLYAYLDASGLSLAKKQKLFYWINMTTKNGVAGAWEQLKRQCRGGSIDTNKKQISLALQELGEISGNTQNLIDFLRAEHDKFEIIKPK